jgi:hypothetical protein
MEKRPLTGISCVDAKQKRILIGKKNTISNDIILVIEIKGIIFHPGVMEETIYRKTQTETPLLKRYRKLSLERKCLNLFEYKID